MTGRNKTALVHIVIGISLSVLLSACANSNSTKDDDGNNDVPSTETTAENNAGGNNEDMVSVPKGKADFLEKHSELVEYIEEENYPAAETYVHELYVEQKKAAAGDIADYLVTVELNSDNFEEYFEFVKVPRYNAFGELENGIGIGVKSLKYDEGLIIYSFDEITVEYEIINNYKTDSKLDSLLYFSLTSGGIKMDDELVYTGRITEGTVTFLKREYVDSYPIPDFEKPDDSFVTTTIQLRNGETISRSMYPEYPY